MRASLFCQTCLIYLNDFWSDPSVLWEFINFTIIGRKCLSVLKILTSVILKTMSNVYPA